MPEPHSPRDRMVFSAAQLIRRHGVTATGMRDVAEHAQAPRGSLQHYFPGGKDQLMAEAAQWAGSVCDESVIARYVAALPEPSPGCAVRRDGPSSGLSRTCAVTGSTPAAQSWTSVAWTARRSTTPTVRRGGGRRVRRLDRRTFADALARHARPVQTGRGVSPLLMISTLEGAILMARAERDLRPLEVAAHELRPLLDAAAQ